MKEIIGSIYTGVSDDFQRGLFPIFRCIKAENHDLGVVEMEVRQIGNLWGEDTEFDNKTSGRVYDENGISPTLNTMQGGWKQPMIVEDAHAIRMVRTEEGKALRKDYESGNIHHGFNEHREMELRTDGVSNTLSTVQKDNYICEKSIVAMRGRNPDNPSDRTAGSPTEQRLEPNSQGLCNTLTSVQKDNLVMEKGVCRIEKEVDYEEGIAFEILRILRAEIGEKDFSEWSIRGLWCVLQEEILRQNVHAKGIYENWTHRPELFKFAYNSKDNQYSIHSEKAMRNMWEEWTVRCTPQRRGLSEQQCRKFDDFMSKLPYEETQRKRFVCCLWKTSEGIGVLREALSEIQKAWESTNCTEMQRCTYRIRKLTPLSCWRLMDFTDEDFYKAESVNSNSQLYKQAGNSIVKNVLVAIIGQMIQGKEDAYKTRCI